MMLKTTIHSLTFALVASLSSFALAQGVGVGGNSGADARLSVAPLTVGVPPEAAAQAGGTQGSASDAAASAADKSAAGAPKADADTKAAVKSKSAKAKHLKSAAAGKVKADADIKAKATAHGS